MTESSDSGSDPAPTSSEEVEGSFNDADVSFAQGMLPHHRQAVEMAEMVQGRTDTPEVLQLAEEIAAAQGPEIQTMTAFLEAWGAEVPEEGINMGSEMEGMDHGGMEGMEGMAGMMSTEDMAAMESATGETFDRMFLEGMVVHHEGAVEMAQKELDSGENPSALALAQEIVDAQKSEISRMQDLLGAA
ncbi:DUF305 domain-containing protein [Aquipuribacter hungaricus]|uniref:DUF305 domain-containing protein n=1 Tax=Aquipuribacter hungaricus TaxID=545624 RepID=A0ABV7WJ31_9MICO